MVEHAVRAGAAPIRVDDLTIDREGARVLGGLTFSLEAGTVHGLVGPNGSGKSTLLHAMAGLVAHGGRVSRSGPVSIMSGQAGYHPARRLRRHLWVVGRQPGVDPDRLTALVRRLDLAELLDRPPTAMSLGQQRAVSLLAPLATRAHLVLLDEPFLALDAGRTRILEELIRERAAQGDTLVVSSHEPQPLSRTATHVLSLVAGRAVFHGPMDELLAVTRPVRVRVRTPHVAQWRSAIEHQWDVPVHGEGADEVLVSGVTMADVLELSHSRGLYLTGIWEEHPTLEEALHLSGSPAGELVEDGVGT